MPPVPLLKRDGRKHTRPPANRAGDDKHIAVALARDNKRKAEEARLAAGREERNKMAKAVVEGRTALVMSDMMQVTVSQLDGLSQVLGKCDEGKSMRCEPKRTLLEDTLE